MRGRPDSYEPWWAPGTDTGFRQRCASALTHPATVVALATLLLNDLLFKAMWPDAWVTGKLSDLAWVAFALPLLAFLLSLFTRGNVIAARAAFLMAYVGLPLLYAAFNTFEPVHYWILRGISIASGGMGRTPLDATDSIVIPLGWAVAVWVLRRPVLSAEALRVRWGLLVAGVAVLASIATSYPPPDYGITTVGVHTTEEGSVVVARNTFGSLHRSDDGGVTWTGPEELTERSVTWGSYVVLTPRGRYTVEGADIVLLADNGQSETVYSTSYLQREANVWAQDKSTGHLNIRIIATHPTGIVYDEQSGNLVVALGIQGVLVGTPDGQWVPHAVGPYTPTDFSFWSKVRLLLVREYGFWAVALPLSMSMTGAGLIFSLSLRGETVKNLTWTIGVLALLASVPFLFRSGVLLSISAEPDRYLRGAPFGPEDDFPLYTVALGVSAFVLGFLSLVTSLEQQRYMHWRAVLASLAGMTFLVFLSFMLWLHLGIAMGTAQYSAVALTGLVAFLLAGYVRWKTP